MDGNVGEWADTRTGGYIDGCVDERGAVGEGDGWGRLGG